MLRPRDIRVGIGARGIARAGAGASIDRRDRHPEVHCSARYPGRRIRYRQSYLDIPPTGHRDDASLRLALRSSGSRQRMTVRRLGRCSCRYSHFGEGGPGLACVGGPQIARPGVLIYGRGNGEPSQSATVPSVIETTICLVSGFVYPASPHSPRPLVETINQFGTTGFTGLRGTFILIGGVNRDKCTPQPCLLDPPVRATPRTANITQALIRGCDDYSWRFPLHSARARLTRRRCSRPRAWPRLAEGRSLATRGRFAVLQLDARQRTAGHRSVGPSVRGSPTSPAGTSCRLACSGT